MFASRRSVSAHDVHVDNANTVRGVEMLEYQPRTYIYLTYHCSSFPSVRYIRLRVSLLFFSSRRT